MRERRQQCKNDKKSLNDSIKKTTMKIKTQLRKRQEDPKRLKIRNDTQNDSIKATNRERDVLRQQ